MSGPAGISIFFRPLQQFELHTTCLTRLGNIKCQVRFQSFHFRPTTQCTKTKSSVKLSQTNYLDKYVFQIFSSNTTKKNLMENVGTRCSLIY